MTIPRPVRDELGMQEVSLSHLLVGPREERETIWRELRQQCAGFFRPSVDSHDKQRTHPTR